MTSDDRAPAADRALVHMAAIFAGLVARSKTAGTDLSPDLPRPTRWTRLEPAEARQEWDDLRHWAAKLCVRYPSIVRLPECWWRHNDLVEVLAALRDYERACFEPTSSATGPVEWQRALRDMEHRLEIWIKKLPCNVPGRGHEQPSADEAKTPPGWTEFVEDDVCRRRKSPTSGPSDEGGDEASTE